MGNSTVNTPPPRSPRPTRKRQVSLPVIAALVAAAALTFVVGRRTAPPAATGTKSSETDTATVKSDPAEAGSAAQGKPAGQDGDQAGPTAASNTGAGNATAIKFDAQSEKLAGIKIGVASFTQLATSIPVNGQIAANPNGIVRVASVVPGRVTQLMVSQGDTVQAGQTLAIIESRSIGEAQSAYQQAVARAQNAQSNLNVVLQQAQAGVFSRAPVEVARKAQDDAAKEARAQETAVRQARVALDNALRLARVGSYASPALEAARAQAATATEALQAAEAALDNANATVQSAQAELKRRQAQAAAGLYVSRPVQEAQRGLVASQAARATAQSEVATTRTNLARAKALTVDGLIAQRDVEAAQQASDTAAAHLDTAQSDETTARQELERQQKLAATDVAGIAEVGQAQAAQATAQADVRTRRAEVDHARAGVRLASVALAREQAVFRQNIANRREVSGAQAALQTAQSQLMGARQTLAVTGAALAREQRIFSQNLNNIAQVQTARSTWIQAQSDLKAARTALELLKSSPNGSASVPVRAPISGVLQTRDVAQGETVEADKNLMAIVNLRTVALEAAIFPRDFVRVRYGSPVSITVEGFSGRTFTGHITFLGSQLDATTRTLTARALIGNPGMLRPGMFARGQVQTGVGATAVVVPRAAVQTLNQQPVVFVPAHQPGEFVAREVKTGATTNQGITITSGLQPGQRVVTEGAFVVKAQAMKSALKDND